MDSRQNQNFILKMTCVVSSLLKKLEMILIISIMCGVVVDVTKCFLYKPQYVSSLTASLNSEENTYSDLENAFAYSKTLDYVFNGQVVKKYVMEQLAVDESDIDCQVASINETNVIQVSVIANTKKNAYFALKHIVEWYQNNMNQYHFIYDLKILEKPVLNERPINQNSHVQNFKNGFLISLAISVLVVAVHEYLRDTIKTPEDIQSKIDCRLFSKIPREKKSKGRRFGKKKKEAILITSLKTSFFYKESIKKLRSRFEQSAKKHQYHSLMMTSSLENEGKSSVAANLALSLAQNSHNVLLIDADIRKPSVHKIFELKTNKTLNAYLEGNSNWNNQIEYLHKHNLFVMCACQDLDHAEDLTRSNRMKNLIQEATKVFDYVIVDTSPAFDLNEPLIINEYVDASFLVVKQDGAPANVINETISRLVNANNNLIGVIYNGSVLDLGKEQKVYGYRYGYNRYEQNERRG